MKSLSNQCPNPWSNSWMRNPDTTKEQQLLEKLIWGGRTNLSEWFEKIGDNFCEEKAIKDKTSVETAKEKFYTEFIEQFLCSLPTLLFKFLIENGAGHIGRRSRGSGRNSLQKESGNTFWASKLNYPGFLKASSRIWGGSWSCVGGRA